MINDVYIGETFDEYLEHHGVPGMKWGVRKARYQKKSSRAKKRFEEFTERAKIAGASGNLSGLNKYTKKATRVNKQIGKFDKKIAKLDVKIEEALKKQAEDDEKTVNNGTVDEVLAISNRLSEDQLKTAISRIKKKQELEGLRPDQTKQVDKLIKVGKKASEIGETAYNIANNFNRFKNVMQTISENDIKAREADIEKGRKNRVLQATRSGDIEQMKKVWGEATIDELRDMKSALDYRNQIINLSEKQKNTSNKKK